MIKIIRFLIGAAIFAFIAYNHQKITEQINQSIDASEEYEAEYDPYYADSDYDDERRERDDYAYDDYDTGTDRNSDY